MNSIEKTLEYHELLMTIDDINKLRLNTILPESFKFSFYKENDDRVCWANIHISSGEFTSYERAFNYFNMFYSNFINELKNRCFFIEYKGEKIATATISPTNEYDYNCVVDWLAIKKEYQGCRLSKPLIYKCLEVARNLGYNKVLLHTQTHTWLAAKIYLDIGFNPFLIEKDIKGWQILKTITNHEKLKTISSIDKEKIFDNVSLNIVKELNKLHKDYSYEIWYKDNMNDVFVNEQGNCFHYKYYDDGKLLEKED